MLDKSSKRHLVLRGFHDSRINSVTNRKSIAGAQNVDEQKTDEKGRGCCELEPNNCAQT